MGCTHSKNDLLKRHPLMSMGEESIRKECKTNSLQGSRANFVKNTRLKLKVLMVCEEEDVYFQKLSNAIDQNKFSKNWVQTPQQAVCCFHSLLPDLIFFDLRNKTLSDEILRALRNVRLDHPMLIIGVVKDNTNDEEIKTKFGFDRVLKESLETNLIMYLKGLQNILSSLEFSKTSMALSESVYTAMDKSRDLVLITDSESIIQYVNFPFLQVLGYNLEEISGKLTTNFQHHMDLVPALRQLEKGSEWVGKLRWKCKNGEFIALQCRALPFTPVGTLPTHYLYMQDNPLENCTYPKINISKHQPDSKSIKDEDLARRKSIAKLYNLPLEAPITKIFSLLSRAQESVSPIVNQMIEQAVDILRGTELYNSEESNLNTANNAQSPCCSDISKSCKLCYTNPEDVKNALDTISSWEFDIIQFENLTRNKPLVRIGMKVFPSFDACKVLKTDDKTVHCWLLTMERYYKRSNHYHNSTHAADVLQAAACFLAKLREKKYLRPIDEACCLIAATTHDLGHPGRTSAFLANSRDELSILYNDMSPLEQHHAALTFKLTLGDERINIFNKLDWETYLSVRTCIIDIILSTDIYKHFEHFSKFVNVFKNETRRESLKPEDLTLMKRMLIKCADISNPTRPWHLCKEWARRISEEYFSQTVVEKTKKLPMTMPLFDQSICSIPNTQIEFMDFIVNKTIEEWNSFIDMPEILAHLKHNYDNWKQLSEKGIRGTEDSEINKISPPK